MFWRDIIIYQAKYEVNIFCEFDVLKCRFQNIAQQPCRRTIWQLHACHRISINLKKWKVGAQSGVKGLLETGVTDLTCGGFVYSGPKWVDASFVFLYSILFWSEGVNFCRTKKSWNCATASSFPEGGLHLQCMNSLILFLIFKSGNSVCLSVCP